jgi:hypothetical protein
MAQPPKSVPDGQTPGIIMGSTERDVKLTPAEAIVATAYSILHLLPAAPDKAAAMLKAVETVLNHPGSQPDGWGWEASYVFSHLRKKDLGTALKALAIAASIIEGRGPLRSDRSW